MNVKIYLLAVLFSLILLSCGNNATESSSAAKVKTTNTTAVTKASPTNINTTPLESIPKETILNLWNTCTYIDYIFHDLPFSMSQDEKESIQANLNYISPEPQPFIPSNCKSIGRQMFHVGGDIVLEADVYLSDVCQFYVFVENEKPVYANKMSPSALQFFGTMFDKVDKQKQK